jgi:2-octaprenyl-6-methoxyphenol hydroxylase
MTKIAILGAGPASMLAALALASKNIGCEIFEQNILNQELFARDIRNFALTDFSIKFFKEIDIWDRIKDYVVPLKTVYIVDNKSTNNMIELSDELSESGSVGYMIKSIDLKTQLLSLILDNPLIKLNQQVSYRDLIFHDHQVEMIFNQHQNSKYDLVIAGDGKNSIIRKKYFQTSTYHDYKQTALILDISHSNQHDHSALEHFTPNGALALLPLLDSYKSSIVWIEDSESANILKKLDRDTLLAHLYERVGSSYGRINIISEIFSYPLSASLTNKYYHNNIILISDSAHTIHPLAGQGLNQGIKDIESLTKLLDKYLKLGLGINIEILKAYEKSRKLDNIKMFKITHYLNMIFANSIPILSGSRKIGLATINKLTFLKKLIINGAMK